MTQLDFDQVVEQARRQGLSVPERVVFGEGKISELPQLLQSIDAPQNVFLVLGAAHAEKTGLLRKLEQLLEAEGVRLAGRFHVSGEPTADLVDRAADACRKGKGAIVIGCGGGSVLDCAKAVAAMSTNAGEVRDYLEGVGQSTLSNRPLPVVAIPTTAGTGSETTRNAVLSVPERGIKRSLRHPDLVPTVALLDPQLTWSSPPSVTATAGMDALTQLIESFISAKRRPDTSSLALRGLPPIRTALRQCYHDPEGATSARAAMVQSAFISGVCLANSGLGMVHGIASGLGGMKDLSHGFICAVLLPHVLRFNRSAVDAELKEAFSAFLQTSPDDSTIDGGIDEIEQLKRDLDLPEDLRELRLSPEEVRLVASRSMGSSMSGNPVPMTVESVAEFLQPLVS
ncbi:MAG TPA: iron-containing alcohol dehydrogenase [Acidobacteriota bacterium]|nr:iron-containing alcohol dehydrogenase [Acidobacteriota bacterium]